MAEVRDIEVKDAAMRSAEAAQTLNVPARTDELPDMQGEKMVLNMLSTGAMILLGKTYGNLMVDVQPTNAKLRRRAVRIVQLATGLAPDAAADLLAACDDETKTAIVAALAGVTPAEARARLTQAQGRVRAALED